jgi:hypothetical protein
VFGATTVLADDIRGEIGEAVANGDAPRGEYIEAARGEIGDAVLPDENDDE